MLIPIHDGYGTEPLTWYRATERLNDFASQMEAAMKEARSALSQVADNMAHFYDAHWREAPLYMVGDKVWLNGKNIAMTRPMKKLDYKWLGPYPVDKVISQSAYRLKLPSSFGQTHPVFSVTLLQPYNADMITEQVQHDPPPPVIHDGVEEYEVELILKSQILRGKLKYLVHWKGYGIEEDEWRPSEDVKGARRLMSEFHRQTPRHPNTFWPSTSPNSPSTPSSTSRTPWTRSLQIGLLVDAHWDTMPLRGG